METEREDSEMERVIALVAKIGKLPSIGPDDDFYDAGLSSIVALVLLTELESAFSVTIPDESFPTARTPRALHNIIRELVQ